MATATRRRVRSAVRQLWQHTTHREQKSRRGYDRQRESWHLFNYLFSFGSVFMCSVRQLLYAHMYRALHSSTMSSVYSIRRRPALFFPSVTLQSTDELFHLHSRRPTFMSEQLQFLLHHKPNMKHTHFAVFYVITRSNNPTPYLQQLAMIPISLFIRLPVYSTADYGKKLDGL